MAAGMGAGIAAIFRAPLAGALFASEVLYRSPEFEPEVIMPAAIASVVSYCTFGALCGLQPLFDTPDITFNDPWRLGPYFLLMLFMILLAALYTHSFYGFVRLFKKIPIPPHFKPAIGAFFTGLIGLALYYLFGRQPQTLAVLSFGYSAIQGAVSDRVHDFGRSTSGYCDWKNPDHGLDHWKRRLRRRFRPLHGHWRLRRRCIRHRVSSILARSRSATGKFCHCGHGRISSPPPPRRRFQL